MFSLRSLERDLSIRAMSQENSGSFQASIARNCSQQPEPLGILASFAEADVSTWHSDSSAILHDGCLPKASAVNNQLLTALGFSPIQVRAVRVCCISEAFGGVLYFFEDDGCTTLRVSAYRLSYPCVRSHVQLRFRR